MSPWQSYQYIALPDPKTHIRLLVLDLDSATLEASIETYSASDAPPYEALSYAWGTQKPTSFLPCEVANIAISPHLLEGIQEMWHRAKNPPLISQLKSLMTWRRRPRTYRLWIDAICINQVDDIEKAGQIPLMTRIYSNAERVLVWLGTATNGTDIAMDSLEYIGNTLVSIAQPVSIASYADFDFPPLHNPIWSGVSEILRRPWFRRLWVVQEIALAKDVTIFAGNKRVEFAVLTRLCKGLYSTGLISGFVADSTSEPHRACMNIHFINGIRRGRAISKHNSICGILHGCRESEVREPVDRIYGLLGLLDDRVIVTPDYTPQARERYWDLYLDVATFIIERDDHGLMLLRFVDFPSKHPMLPSWVPNWNNRLLCIPFDSFYNAGILSDSFGQQHSILESKRLKARGISFGTIISTSPLVYRSMNIEDQAQLVQAAISNLKMIHDALNLYHATGPDEMEGVGQAAFARTLIADVGFNSELKSYTPYRQNAEEDLGWYMRYLEERPFENPNPAFTASLKSKHIEPYVSALPTTWQGRCFFITDTGKIGLASQACQVGDEVCILFDGATPFVLRPVENKDSFFLIGEAYVDGIMYGEALEPRDTSLDRDFIID